MKLGRSKKKTTRPFMNETYNSILGLGKNLGRFARNQKQLKKRIHTYTGRHVSKMKKKMQQKEKHIGEKRLRTVE